MGEEFARRVNVKRDEKNIGGVVVDRPVAKGKKRVADEKEAIEKFEKESLKVVKAATGSATRHRDEVATGEILNIVADVIDEVTGGKIDAVNAREFYAMNLIRPLRIKHGISFRDHEVPHSLCREHS